MKHTKQRNIKLGILLLISVSLLVFLFNEVLTGNQFTGVGNSFDLPEMQTAGGSNPHTDDTDSNVSCDIKSTLYVVDDKGQNIKTVQSSMLDDIVPFDLVNPSDDRPVSVFVVIPKIFCTTDNESVTVTQSDLNLKIYGDKLSISESKKQSLNSHYKKSGGLGETPLSWFSITDKTIEKELEKSSTFTSNIRFDISGNIEMVYDNQPTDKMTIPINQGDIMTKWFYKSIASVSPDSTDADGDGISDKYDHCKYSKETFNGYNDSDGCPDSVPNTPEATPIPPVTPVDKNSCNAKNKTWYITSDSDGLCGTKNVTGGTFCKEYDARQSVLSCIDPKPISNDIPAKIMFQVNVKMNGGGNQAYLVQDDPSPFELDIPLSLISNDNIIGQTAQFNIEPRLVIEDYTTHKLTNTKSSNLNIDTIITVQGNDYSLGSKSVSMFIPKNGGGLDIEVGFPLGSIDVLSSKIENAIPLDVVPSGSEALVDVRFVVDGSVGISVNSGSIIQLDITGADFEIKNLKMIRGGVTTPEPTPEPPRTSDECKADEHRVITGIDDECVPNDIDTDPEELNCKDNEHIELFNSIPECVVNTGDEIDQCPDNTSNCIIITDNTKTDDGESTITYNDKPVDDNLILFGATGVLLLGFVAYLIKRRN